MLSQLGIMPTDNPTTLPAGEVLRSYTQAQLKSLCEQRGLRTSGTKEVLVTNLLDSPPLSPQIFVPQRMISCWFLKPISSSYFKLGSKNENNIRDALPEFILRCNSRYLLIDDIVERGLLRRKSPTPVQASRMATSVDGLEVLKGTDGDNLLPFVLALKSKLPPILKRELANVWRKAECCKVLNLNSSRLNLVRPYFRNWFGQSATEHSVFTTSRLQELSTASLL